MTKIKVAVGLSGGVDSAVSAYLLKKQGFDISGCYLHCFDDDAPGCRGKQDRQDALKVAVHLKIPFRVLDFRRQYKSSVIGYFKKEYLAGRTPNPDVVCNRDIKFGLFLDWAIKAGFDYVATGHYADGRHPERPKGVEGSSVSDKNILIASPRLDGTSLGLSTRPDVRRDSLETTEVTEIFLSQPKDLHKDQTYFLWAVSKEKFRRVLFPLADFRKQDVRSVAKFAKIPVADKPDSTGICFIGEVRVGDFLKRLGVKEKEGEVVIRKKMATMAEMAKNGYNHSSYSSHSSPFIHYQIIGRHRGVWFYTIGQRHGFSVDRRPPKNRAKGQRPKAKGNAGPDSLSPYPLSLSPDPDRPPLYVIEKDVKTNRLIVGFGADCYRDNFEVAGCNWLTDCKTISNLTKKARPFRKRPGLRRSAECFVRIRHGGELIPCKINALTHQRITVSLRFAQRGIAPGQSAVFYSKDGIVLGGGVIR